MSFCNGGVQCDIPAEHVVDADMNGIGVVLSFVITAAISVIVAVMAVLKRGIPKQQYMRVDEKVLYWIGVRKPANESPSNLGYQSLLLALSDQMLAVGLCYLIAMYAQVCKVSLYSFYIGAQLGYLSSTVHLCTLLVLKSYFRKHPKQALLRGGLMMLFLGLLVATLILEFITLSEPRDRLFLCGLHYPVLPRLGSMGVRCFSIAVMLAFVYWNAFRSIKLDNSLRYELENNTSKNTILRWIYSGGQRKVDFQKYLGHEEKDKRQRNRKKVAILEQSPEFLETFTMVTPLIVAEMAASVLFELLVAIFSFSIALYTLVIGVFYQGADVKPLLTASFGQIMPMLLLIVIALTAVEVGTIKNFRRIEIEIEIKKHPALLHNTTRGGPGSESNDVLSSRVQSFNLQNSMTGVTEDVSLQNPPKTYGTSLLPMAAASHSQPDLSGTAGFGSRVDSMTRWMTPRRTTTIELEEGGRSLLHAADSTLDLLDIALRSAKGITYAAICLVLFLLAGYFVACFLFYQYVVPATAGVLIIGGIFDLLRGVRGVHRIRSERLQKEIQI
ncbi:hypothetical protein FOPG_02293 [Fusarium oxysporum f. sp. conglutinans race 2 54008]|uniref:Uncharacterized protein n=1 Tax=Fusarium oxysporum f. sp. conglutinans race 2 54008 TaxID=1089457 RepID=X0IBB1_FUSOX|nr:hypothetical protein FOPG_02293 [Fusarium oxysporum f. sp. conglutinans race 2 54008]KAG6981488.1 hypothetical protein FocnCong_v008607 [Fusarium oxysporum f. sp. conglutinans]KAH7229184.1 hypothetical protein BKA60DRAFT_19004 [Fusarium oxysporum]KAI8415094.1 hypothetical protein FOFC_04714 [Fusarium oxysporum]